MTEPLSSNICTFYTQDGIHRPEKYVDGKRCQCGYRPSNEPLSSNMPPSEPYVGGHVVSKDVASVWPDRCFVWHDGTRFVLSIVRPERGIVSHEYGRFLSKADLFKLASLEDGVDTGRYVNNLLRVIENQTKEINRLRSRRVGRGTS